MATRSDFQTAIDTGDLDRARLLLNSDGADQAVLSACFKWLRQDNPHAIQAAMTQTVEALAAQKKIPLLLDLWNRMLRRKRSLLDEAVQQAANYLLTSTSICETATVQPIDTTTNTAASQRWLQAQSPRFAPLAEAGMQAGLQAFYHDNHLIYCLNREWRIDALDLPEFDLTMSRRLMFIIKTPAQLVQLLQRHLSLPKQEVYQWDRYLIVEPWAAALAFQLQDPSKLSAGEYRYHLIAPDNFERETAAFCRRGYTLADRVIGLPGAQAASYERWCAQRMRSQEEENEQRVVRLQSYYSNDFEHNLRSRLGNEPKGARVLLFTSKFSSYVQYGTRDLAGGFRQLGCHTLIHKEHKTQGIGFSKYHLYRLIERIRPDIIVAINNFCSQEIRTALPGIPFLTWMQDPPYTLTIPPGLSEFDHVFAIGTRFIRDFPKAAPSQVDKIVHLLPVAFEPSVYKPLPNCEKHYDISYVANLEMTPEIASFYHSESKTDTIREAITHLAMTHMANTAWQNLKPFFIKPANARSFLDALLQELDVSLSPREYQHTQEFLVAKLTHFFIRTGQLRALIEAGHESVFIGGAGWDRVPFFQPYARGRVNNGADLNRVYNQTRINLHASPEISFHHKVGEVLGSGGFMMTLAKPGYDILAYDGFFKVPDEMVTYRDTTELVEKTGYYLANPAEREAVAMRARKTLFKRFTVQHAARNLLAPVLDGN